MPPTTRSKSGAPIKTSKEESLQVISDSIDALSHAPPWDHRPEAEVDKAVAFRLKLLQRRDRQRSESRSSANGGSKGKGKGTQDVEDQFGESLGVPSPAFLSPLIAALKLPLPDLKEDPYERDILVRLAKASSDSHDPRISQLQDGCSDEALRYQRLEKTPLQSIKRELRSVQTQTVSSNMQLYCSISTLPPMPWSHLVLGSKTQTTLTFNDVPDGDQTTTVKRYANPAVQAGTTNRPPDNHRNIQKIEIMQQDGFFQDVKECKSQAFPSLLMCFGRLT